MPHGESWLTLLLGKLGVDLAHAGEAFSFGQGGKSWYAHETIGLDHVLTSLLIFVILAGLAFVAYGKVKDAAKAIVPDETLTIRTALEIIVGAVYGLMSDIMGPKAAKFFLPLIGTCALFILLSNGIGLVPGFSPPTGKMNTTLALGAVIFVTTHVYGVKENGLAYFKHFLGPIVKWYALPLMLLMLGIEVISHIARPISLAIRLMANMAADHMVVSIFLTLVPGVPFLVPVPVMLLGTIVVIVQTLVFCLLSTVYIALAIAHEEH
jgi:F-type H+-transporting ATPase subunit a